jgi:hypothetical protein
MHWLRFVAFNALGAALWVGTWVSVGYFAGQHITTIYNAITRYSLYAAIAAVVLIAAWAVYRLRKHRKGLADAVQQGAVKKETAAQPQSPAAAGEDGNQDRAAAGEDGNQDRAAAGEDGNQDRAARQGQGLTGPQDSERS